MAIGRFVTYSGRVYVFEGEGLISGLVLLRDIEDDSYISAPVDDIKEY